MSSHAGKATGRRGEPTVGAGGQGFEPCRAALEAACSPRSILLCGPGWVSSARMPNRGTRPDDQPGNSGGVEPTTSAFTEPRANRYTTNCIGPRRFGGRVILGGLEPPLSSVSGRRPTFGPQDYVGARWAPVPRPGFEPGPPRSKRGMISVSPPGHSANNQYPGQESNLDPHLRRVVS